MQDIKIKAKLVRTLKVKDDGWKMASFEIIESSAPISTDPRYGTALVMGMIEIDPNSTVQKMIVREMPAKKGYNTSYSLIDMDLSLDLENESEIKNFLLDIITEKQYENMLKLFPLPKDIIKAMEEGSNSLSQVKGLGEVSVDRILKRYNDNKSTAGVRGKLSAFMPEWMLRRILSKWKGNMAVKKVTEDPYCLIELPGIGFKRADEVYLRMGKDPKAPERIKRLIIDCLEDSTSSGNSWITRQDLWRAIVEKVPGIGANVVQESMSKMGKELVQSSDGQRIGLRSQSDVEKEISKHLIRLMRAKPMAVVDNLEESILETEAIVGYQFSDEQKNASRLINDNNVFLLTGLAGSGKSTSTKVITDAFQKKGYFIVGCALSGKAASVLTQSTGIQAATIHRTLKWGSIEDPNDPDKTIMGFKHNERNQLQAQLVIVDEVSMVDTSIFLHLLRAIPTGCRLVMLGDRKQLRAIGIPIQNALLQSKCIPTTDLKKVHRQAAKSGVIMHANVIREKKSPMTSDRWKIHGELQDLTYLNAETDDEIPMMAIKAFKKRIGESPINEVQIITQTRTMVEALNKKCQEVYNPPCVLKNEIEIGYEKKTVFREGDKVLCIKNNYNAIDLSTNKEEGVYNGNVGIINAIKLDVDPKTGRETKTIHIDFEGIGLLSIDEANFNTLQLGYAITVHKSQGSGFNHVICALPFHFTLNSLNLFYTAMTRTRTTCDMIIQKSVMDRGVRKEESELCNTFIVTYLRFMVENYAKEQIEGK